MEESGTASEVKIEACSCPAADSSSVVEPTVAVNTKWEIAAVTYFASCFHKIWHLPQVYAEDIEDGCISVCEDLASQFFVDFFIGLLQSFRKSVEINRDNYEIYLKRIAFEAGKGELLSRFAEQNFWALPTASRVELLLALCYARIDFDVNSQEGKLKDVDAGQIRSEPLGEDANGNIYWHFGDTRLYRDIPPPPPPSPPKKPQTPKSKSKAKKKGRGKRGKRKGAKSTTKADKSAADTTNADLSMDATGVAEKVEPPPDVARWEIVCSTFEEWQTFITELSLSHNKNDIHLHEKITERVVPVLQEIFAEKERTMKKRLLMMAPRRQSYRLEEKRKAFVDAERFISYIANDGQMIDNGTSLEKLDDTPAQASEEDLEQDDSDQPKRKFRRPPVTNEEALERKRRFDEEAEKSRQKAASARANRANRRAEGLPASGISDTESQEADKTIDSEDLEMDYYRMEEMLASVCKHQDAPPFLEPVPTSLAPDYYEVIKRPMDLNVMSRKLMQRQYTNITEMVADFDQLCQNCITYNGPQNPYSTRVRRLSRHFQTILRQNFPQAARERQERGFVGQPQHHSHLNQSQEDGNKSMDVDNVADVSLTSLSPDLVWNGGKNDPDWSPRQSHERRSRSDRPPTQRRRSAAPKSEASGYSSLCNNLDQLLGTEVDGDLVSGAVHEMASIRAKSSSKRASVPLQPNASDFLAGYQRSQRPQASSQLHNLPASHTQQPRPRRSPSQSQPTRQQLHQYSMLQSDSSSLNSTPPSSSSQTATILKQTPTGLTSLPGAYFRPTIGELPPPVRRVTASTISHAPSSGGGTVITAVPVTTTTTTNGASLRSLLVASPGATTSTATSTAIRYKPVLVSAAKPQLLQHQQQMLQHQQLHLHQQQQSSPQTSSQQSVAYIMPISLAQGSTSGNTTVLLVQQPSSGVPVVVGQQSQSAQQFTLARVTPVAAQVQQVAAAPSQPDSSAQKQAPSASTPSSSTTSSTSSGQQSFSNAFFKFVSSSSARV